VLKDQPNGGYLLHDENEDQEGYDRFILSFKQSNRIYHLLVFYENGKYIVIFSIFYYRTPCYFFSVLITFVTC